jgi:uncharacterized protein
LAPELFAVEEEWRKLTALDPASSKIWADAYLIAFARAAGMRLVTLDRALLRMADEALLLN